MTKVFKWFMPLLIGAMILPTFVGCESEEDDTIVATEEDVELDSTVDSDGDGSSDITTGALEADDQKSKMQSVATSMINAMDANSAKPILNALDALIQRLDDVELPEELQEIFEEDYDYGDDYVDNDTSDTYYTGYAASKIMAIASIRDIVAGDISTLNDFVTVSTRSTTEREDIDVLGYLADVYGTFTLNSDDTWTYAEASNKLTFIVDDYTLTMNISGSVEAKDIESYYYKYSWDGSTHTSTQVKTLTTLTIPQNASITVSSGSTTLVSLSANVTELDVMGVTANISASASFADFTVTSTSNISNGTGLLVNELKYNDTSMIKITGAFADLDEDSFWEATENSASDLEMGGAKVTCEIYGGALCLTASVSNVGDFAAELETINNSYTYSTYSYTEDNDSYTYNYTYGYEEAYCKEMTTCLNNNIDLYWGFDSTSDVQGKVELDYSFETSTSSNQSWNDYITWYDTYNDYEFLPILIFGDDSRIDIESFFTETSFSDVIDAAMDLVDEVVTLMEDYPGIF